ncbi:Eco57I restriction-modification methylase domain-containing protein, partial [Chloroflexota bacterium]
MIELNDLLGQLGYSGSSHYKRTDGPLDLETAHLFRAAGDAGVNGVYVFEASPSSTNRLLAPRPAVYIAKVDSEVVARGIHRSLWNLGYAPFLIILLPNQIRIYTGFNYSQELESEGLLCSISLEETNLQQVVDLLSSFKASAIDTGFIWKSEYSKSLDQDRRVDKRLLNNLQELGEALEKANLPVDVAHALIGKYVYLSYLRSKDILTDKWIKQQGIELNNVFSPYATVSGLQKLVEALEDRFNGRIFPIDFQTVNTLSNEHVALVASVFTGAEIPMNASEFERQLHLDFKAYDFSYIPVETLSAIYEQFIRNRKEKGAIYTPEVLADYVLSEMEWAKPLERSMKVLDPACGSGVFLVLAYRRLIEKELHNIGHGEKLKAEKLCDILRESIYGIEKETDACYVTEFSLILTLLHYAEPRELQSLQFKFPPLHNTRIFNCDFFDFKSEEGNASFWQKGLKFDWITGNPPWIELKPPKPDVKDEMRFIRTWMEDPNNKSERPTGGKRIAEVFSWLVTDLLEPNGIVGLILPATSLFNLESKSYRQCFFSKNEILRITNFANLRAVLFGKDKSGVLPAATIIYRKAENTREKQQIIHYAPFSVNQIAKMDKKPWVIIINENEIKTISSTEAEKGDMQIWKLALWGSYRDKRTIERIRHLFPKTLEDFCLEMGWGSALPREGAQLRAELENPDSKWGKAKVKGQKQFDTKIFNSIKPRYRYSIPNLAAFKTINEDLYVRTGEETLKLTTPAPHIILSASWQNFAIYSDQDFIVPPRQMVIAAPKEREESELYLRALTVYLSSSLVAYYLFFQVPEWGIFRQRKSVVTREVRKIPTPKFTLKQAEDLASLHREIVLKEQTISHFMSDLNSKWQNFKVSGLGGIQNYKDLPKVDKLKANNFASGLQVELQQSIDKKISNLFEIPEDIRMVADEFVKTRLLLDKPSARESITRTPTDEDLLSYARQLRDELDAFVMGDAYHRITIIYSKELVECTAEITHEQSTIPISSESVKTGNTRIADLLDEVSKGLRERISQWVYVQKGLRLYEGPRVHIYKTPRLI